MKIERKEILFQYLINTREININDLTNEEIEAIYDDIHPDYRDEFYSYENYNYLILDEANANEWAKTYIKETVWAFNASFITSECDLDPIWIRIIQMAQQECELSNDVILDIIEKFHDLDDFVDAAIAVDGRGSFLSGYDGEEHEINYKDKFYYIYKQ